MYNILIPVDFSETSVNALNYALKLFRSQAVKVTLLSAYKSYSGAFHMKSMDQVLEEDVERQMAKLVARYEQDWPDVFFKSMVSRGDAVSIITSMGDSGKYDLVVMGTTGASGLKEVFLGSVAGGVISHTSAAVLVVPSNSALEEMSTIVLAIGDGVANIDVVLQPLKTLQGLLDCNIDIVHVQHEDEDEAELEGVLSSLNVLGRITTLEPGHGSVNDQLDQYMGEVNAGILTLIRMRKGFMDRLFKGSVTMKQAFLSKFPLLILHG